MPDVDKNVIVIPAREGRAVRLSQGDCIKVINTHGTQVVDFFALNAGDPNECTSMPHCRNSWGRLRPKPGDRIVSTLTRPIVAMVEDHSPGVHDALMPSCDSALYRMLRAAPDHINCADNFRAALESLGLTPPTPMPTPLNLFQNTPFPDGKLAVLPPESKPGDFVVFRAEMDCVVVMTACPFDLAPVNGADCVPKDAAYTVLKQRAR